MGYSITEAQYQKLENLKHNGRLCCMSTGRGGCFTRATVKNHCESFSYNLDDGEASYFTHNLCKRHANDAGYEGVNFRVLSVERY